MKTSWSHFMKGTLAILLLGSGMVFGDEAVSAFAPETDQANQTQPNAGLTPHKKLKTKTPVLLAQQPSPPDVFAIQAAEQLLPPPPPPQVSDSSPILVAASQAPAPSADPFVYSELDRLAAEVAKLKKDTKIPNTKKAWSTPKLTGRLWLDCYSIDQDDNAEIIKNKAGVREMQFAITGNGFDSFDYKLELSLSPSGGQVNLVDNWIGVKNVPLLGYLRAGHYKPETGMANPTSALHTPLSEFTGTSTTFGFGRRLGVSSEHLFAKDRIRLFYGIFQGDSVNSINNSRSQEDDNQGDLFNIRLSAAPIFENEGQQVLHLGGSYSYVNTKKDRASMSIQPGAISWYSTPSLQTGNFFNDHQHRFGLELALQNGHLSMASELFAAQFAGYHSGQTRTATGGYVQLGYFLTQDAYRTYGLNSGTFGAAKVKHNFHPYKSGDYNLIDGFGAWQLVAVWNYLDLTDWRGITVTEDNKIQHNGGFQHDLTFGLNWFWNPNIRWIFEYIHSQQNYGIAHSSRNEDIFGTSLRIHF